MGERAFEQAASEDDLRGMERELRDAIRAGAIGFTTSRSPNHETPDRRPVASRLATWRRFGGWSAAWGTWTRASSGLPARRFAGTHATHQACRAITCGCRDRPGEPDA